MRPDTDRVRSGLARTGAAILVVAAVAGSALSPGSAQAHPHAWIDFHTQPVVDETGAITGLRQHWRFDVFYTLFIVESLHANAGAVEDAALLEVAQTSLTNLHPYDYFTEVSQGDREVGFKTATDLETGLEGEALWMTFTVPFTDPLSPAHGPIQYKVYDPEFFVEMRHVGDAPIRLVGGLADCQATVVDGEPTVEQTLFAASLDTVTSPGFNLGEVFAQTATIQCAP